MKQCNKCKCKKPIKEFHKNKTRVDGHHYWCKACMCTDKKRYIKENPEKAKKTSDNANRLPHSRFLQLVRGAKQRDLKVEISEQEYFSLLSVNKCYYCAEILNLCGHGMDRYDNTLGYTIANTVPCCATCNSMKSKLHGDVFITKIRAVAQITKDIICLA